MNHHTNIHGDCNRCIEIFDKYPGFNEPLRTWFNSVRRKFFDAHISCAGRGRIDQEADYARGASHAHYGKSAHNYNMAIDIFRLDPSAPGQYSLDRRWFDEIFAMFPLGSKFTWYGAPGSPFRELPHIEVAQWYNIPYTENAKAKLVEP